MTLLDDATRRLSRDQRRTLRLVLRTDALYLSLLAYVDRTLRALEDARHFHASEGTEDAWDAVCDAQNYRGAGGLRNARHIELADALLAGQDIFDGMPAPLQEALEAAGYTVLGLSPDVRGFLVAPKGGG